MKKRFWRVPMTLIAAAACTLMLGAAALIGRATETTVVAVDLTGDADLHQVKFGLLDVGRQYLLTTVMTVPNKYRSQFGGQTIRVAQRRQYLEFADWTFSEIDVKTGALMPLLTVTTSSYLLLNPYSVHPLDDTYPPDPRSPGRWRIYLPDTGEVWQTDGSGPRSQIVAKLNTHLSSVQWLDGGERLTAMSIDGMTAMNLDGSDRRDSDIRISSDFAQPWTSPDGARLMMRTFTLGAANKRFAVYDAATFAPVAEYSGYSPTWCGEKLAYFEAVQTGGTVSHLVDLDAGTDAAVTLSGTNIDMSDVNINPLSYATCEWFMFRGALQGRNWLLHRATGTFIGLGYNGRVLDLSGGAITYQTQIGDALQLRRIALVSDPLDSELLEEHRSLGANITYTDGWWRGLFMVVDKLMFVDMLGGRQWQLAGPGVRSFYVMD